MKQAVPALSPLLRSNTQGDILAMLFLEPGREWMLADIQRRTGANPSMVHREIERLMRGGVVVDRRIGRSRLVRAESGYELFEPLSEIVLRTYGPRAMLAQLLHKAEGVDAVYIYGSWAARYMGEEGRSPRDIDVLVVGDASRESLNRVALATEQQLAHEVNMTRISGSDWEASESLFLKTLRERPLVEVPIS